MTTKFNTHVKGDRALQNGDKDRLGLRKFAAKIALTLVDRTSKEGLVAGIEGAWGSGKSSLIYLIEDELGKLPETDRPTVLNFQPWLVGNRDALIGYLFAELSKKLNEVALNAGDDSAATITKVNEASKALRKFATALGKFGGTVKLVGDATGTYPIKMVGKAIIELEKLALQKPDEPPLADLKAQLIDSLEALDHSFIITIDDTDRLEPNEVIEVLRLVRSVADFPNVTYLLCYDREILSHSIESAAQIKCGGAYLEKIVQLTLMVPTPEAFQLRQWFSEELCLLASPKDEEELVRLKSVIDYEGGRQLRTPRSVVRTLDAIRFFWPPLQEVKGDLADLVWLLLIKDGNPRLYSWIEEYCVTAAILSLGATQDENTRISKLTELHECVESNYFGDQTYCYYFSEPLSGMERDISDEKNTFKLFQNVSDDEREAAIVGARLASPDHYRFYFTLSGPSYALTQDNFSAMWAAAVEEGCAQTQSVLLELHKEEVLGSLGKADMMLERIKEGNFDLTPKQCENFLVAFSQAMDEAYRIRPFDTHGVISLWDRAEKLLPLFFSHLDRETYEHVLKTMFEEGAAIGWLTSILRRETFAHGRYGEQRRPEDDWLFSDAELDMIIEAMLARYRSMSAGEVYDVINLMSLLFAWRQAGDKQGPRELVEAASATDEGLIKTLENMTNIVYSGRGSFNVLKKVNLSPFLEYDTTVERVTALQHNEKFGERAKHLAAAFSDNP